MKKVLLLLSITIMTVWIIGFFILRLSSPVHILLLLAILVYIRSLICVDSSPAQKYYGASKDIDNSK